MQDPFSQCGSLAAINLTYRRLAARYHPDRGGDSRVMQRINALRDAALQRVRQAAYDPWTAWQARCETRCDDWQTECDALARRWQTRWDDLCREVDGPP